jgi:hypothetical protein
MPLQDAEKNAHKPPFLPPMRLWVALESWGYPKTCLGAVNRFAPGKTRCGASTSEMMQRIFARSSRTGVPAQTEGLQRADESTFLGRGYDIAVSNFERQRTAMPADESVVP